jgi:hypothetical protein
LNWRPIQRLRIGILLVDHLPPVVHRVIEAGEDQPLAKRDRVRRLAGLGEVPGGRVLVPQEQAVCAVQPRARRSGLEPLLKRIEPLHRARIRCSDMLPPGAIVGQLGAQCSDELGNLAPLVDAIDELLGSQRDQYAERDDRELPGDRVPAVRRLQLQ